VTTAHFQDIGSHCRGRALISMVLHPGTATDRLVLGIVYKFNHDALPPKAK
jgi:hypothetical protein